jgi:hypothetical protein
VRRGRPGRLVTDGGPVELSLAAPFGALVSSLSLERPFRVSRLALDHVAPDQLASSATFSAKPSNIREDGEASVSLLVYRGPRLFVRGEANVLMSQAKASKSGRTSNGRAGSALNGGHR